MDVFGTVEAVKAVSDLYCSHHRRDRRGQRRPRGRSRKVNSDPYGAGWMLKIRVTEESELDALLGAEEYEKVIGG
jgi:glycine cleavage system H protein